MCHPCYSKAYVCFWLAKYPHEWSYCPIGLPDLPLDWQMLPTWQSAPVFTWNPFYVAKVSFQLTQVPILDCPSTPLIGPSNPSVSFDVLYAPLLLYLVNCHFSALLFALRTFLLAKKAPWTKSPSTPVVGPLTGTSGLWWLRSLWVQHCTESDPV